MDDRVRMVLRDLVAEYGPGLCGEPRRMVGLLKDLCPGYRREVALLAHALDDGVPEDLLTRSRGTPLPSLLALLATRLHDHQGTDRTLAAWAVETWAVALGLMPPAASLETRAAPGSRVVAIAGGTHTTIISALAGLSPDETVMVRPGRSTQPLTVHGSLTLQGDGAGVVALATAGVPCLTVTGGSVIVRGFTLRSEGAEATVLVTGGTLYLEGCDIGGERGVCVRVAGPGAAVHLRHCRLHDAATAGIAAADEATVSAEEALITGTGLAAVEASAGAMVTLARCTLADGEGNGLFVTSGAEARLDGCTLTRHAFAGVEGQAGSAITLAGCTVQDGAGAGLRLLDRATALIEDTRIRRHALAGVDIESGARLTMHGGRIEGGGRAGVRAGCFGVAHIEGVQIRNHAGPGIDVEEDGYLEVRACRITGNVGAAVRAAAGASGLIEDCDLAGNTLGAWMLDDGSELALIGNQE